MYTSYREMFGAIKAREDFKGSSVSAVTWASDIYEVYSYNTLIARFSPNGDIFYDDTFYSMTTRKIQSILRRYINEYCVHLPQYTLGKRGGIKRKDRIYQYNAEENLLTDECTQEVLTTKRIKKGQEPYSYYAYVA